jgi:hypothetical protein
MVADVCDRPDATRGGVPSRIRRAILCGNAELHTHARCSATIASRADPSKWVNAALTGRLLSTYRTKLYLCITPFLTDPI